MYYLIHLAAAIEVFIVPHSHLDAGWLFPIDFYYQNAVQHIFNTVVNQMQINPAYTYTLGDVFYF
jgi:hypothetical protein